MRVILIVVGLLLVGCGGEHAVSVDPGALLFDGAGSQTVTVEGLADGVVVEGIALDAGPEFGRGGVNVPHDLDGAPMQVTFFFALGGVVDAGEYEGSATVITSHGDFVVDLFGTCAGSCSID